jgi:hypothetical protein
MMREIKNTKTVSVEVLEVVLNKLAWAFPGGNVEQRVDFCLGKVIKRSEKEEGMTYPEDQLPYKTFEHVTVIT